MKYILLRKIVIVVGKLTRSGVLWGGAGLRGGLKGRGWSKKIFPVMQGSVGIGKDKTMWGWG